MHSRRALLLAMLLGLVGWIAPAGVRSAAAAELIMFDQPNCPWCRLWHKEIGPAYPSSEEGRRAPLRIVDLRDGPPRDVVLDAPVRASPTFVLVENGREVGRITGYPGAEFFWGLLGDLLAKLDEPPADRPAPRAPGARSL